MAGIFDGLTKGVTKGLQYELEMNRLLIWAIHSDNHEAKIDCLEVLTQWVSEAEMSKGILKGNLATLLLTTDPFSGSRKLAQDAIAKWGKH